MIFEILFLLAILWLQTQIGAILKNRTSSYYALKAISLIVFGLNCFVIFSFARFFIVREVKDSKLQTPKKRFNRWQNLKLAS